MALSVHQLAERPDLEASMLEIGNLGVWPEFMLWDATAGLYFGHLDWWPEYVLVAVDDDPNVVVARAFSIPFVMDGEARGRRELPDGGWDRVVQWGHADKEAGRTPTHVSALEITMRPDRLGRGSSASMVTAMRDNARRLGFRELVAPVRPNRKHEHPHMAMAEYVERRRSDGLPDDPWLRVHVRLGAEIVKIAHVVDDDHRHAGGVAGLDGPAVRRRRGRRRPGGPGPGPRQRAARPRGVRRAERVDAPPALTGATALEGDVVT